MNPAGKVVLVTGGAGGIGRAVARRFLGGGARVVLWDLSAPALEEAARALDPGGTRVRTYALDVSDRAAVADAAARVRAEVGEVDVLDNNAAVVTGGAFLSVPEETLARTTAVNVDGVMWCTRAFLPGMLARGSGHLVMMASAAGLLGVPGMAAYSASKHAVIGFAESLRGELRRQGARGVGMTIVCPSFVRTGMFAGVTPPRLAPWLEPEELADRVYGAVLSGRLYVREPALVKLVPALKGLTSSAVADWVGRLLGMDRAMDGWTGR